ncbi:hypothetical protein BKA81DRAFT_41635 [Phyllosticta paracitricarpa]
MGLFLARTHVHIRTVHAEKEGREGRGRAEARKGGRETDTDCRVLTYVRSTMVEDLLHCRRRRRRCWPLRSCIYERSATLLLLIYLCDASERACVRACGRGCRGGVCGWRVWSTGYETRGGGDASSYAVCAKCLRDVFMLHVRMQAGRQAGRQA